MKQILGYNQMIVFLMVWVRLNAETTNLYAVYNEMSGDLLKVIFNAIKVVSD